MSVLSDMRTAWRYHIPNIFCRGKWQDLQSEGWWHALHVSSFILAVTLWWFPVPGTSEFQPGGWMPVVFVLRNSLFADTPFVRWQSWQLSSVWQDLQFCTWLRTLKRCVCIHAISWDSGLKNPPIWQFVHLDLSAWHALQLSSNFATASTLCISIQFSWWFLGMIFSLWHR